MKELIDGLKVISGMVAYILVVRYLASRLMIRSKSIRYLRGIKHLELLDTALWAKIRKFEYYSELWRKVWFGAALFFAATFVLRLYFDTPILGWVVIILLTTCFTAVGLEQACFRTIKIYGRMLKRKS